MKIAICVSGETRDFNKILKDTSHRSVLDFAEDLRKFNTQVDVYAHTWAHCEYPDRSDMIKSLSIDDQSIIDNWVSGDFLNRAFPIPNAGSFHDYLLASRKAYGQVFSGFRCFGLVPVNEYDVVIRFRWDLECVGDLEFIEKVFLPIAKQLAITDKDVTRGVGTSDIIIESSQHQTRTVIQDSFFMLNSRGHDYITAQSIEDKLEDIFRDYPGNEKTTTHNLWFDCIFTPPRFKNPDPIYRKIGFDMSMPAHMFQIIKKNYSLED